MLLSANFKVTIAGCILLISSIISCFISTLINKKISQVENVDELPV